MKDNNTKNEKKEEKRKSRLTFSKATPELVQQLRDSGAGQGTVLFTDPRIIDSMRRSQEWDRRSPGEEDQQ